MTKKADFNADEWAAVAEAPLLAGMRVIKAGRGGTLRESMALGKTYAEARRRQGASELLDELVAAPPAMDTSRLQQAGGDIDSVSRDRLNEAKGVLDAKATSEEADAYKQFVLGVAEAVASAHKEGGFLGVGGKDVSDTEQAALDDIAASLQ